MFDYRQERLDEIYEIEAPIHDLVEPAAHTSDAVVQPGFQLPQSVWFLMVGCYVIFMGAMAAVASASSFALFMVAISVIYVVIFFSMSTFLANLSGKPGGSPLDKGQALPTWCGPMSRGSVYGQVLIVPAGIAFFGVSVALIAALAG